MPAISTLNAKAPPATTSEAFKLVLTTARPIQKDQTHVYYHIPRAPYRPR